MSKTSKHHYISRFFLEGFTNTSGVFYIYDKRRKVIKTKEYYSSTHFFHKDRNSILIDNELVDTPEQLYCLFENKNKKIIQFLQQSEGILTLTDQQLVEVQYFLGNLFVRLPILDNLVQSFRGLVHLRLVIM